MQYLIEEPIVDRLRIRAKIRREATNRTLPETDRIADLLEEAANVIEELRCNSKGNK